MAPSTRAGVAPAIRRCAAVAVISGATILGACASPAPLAAAPPRAVDPPAAPYAPGLAPVDASQDPCFDFEVFACGSRLGPRSKLARSGDLVAHRFDRLRELVARLIAHGAGNSVDAGSAGAAGDNPAPDDRPLRDYLIRCADPASRAAGLAELRSELAALSGASTMTDLARLLGRLRASGPGILIYFRPATTSVEGKRLLTVRVGLVDPMLPRRFYPDQRAVREYRGHWETLAVLSGGASAADAEAATRVDAWLAKVGPLPSDDPATRGPFGRARLERRRFPWVQYLNGFSEVVGVPVSGPFSVYDPGDLRLVDGLLTLPFEAIRSYTRILLIERWAELVTKDLLDAELRFHEGTLHGLVVRGPGWNYAESCIKYLPAPLFNTLVLADLEQLADAKAEERADRFLGELKALLTRGIEERTSVRADVRRATAAHLAETRSLFVRELATLYRFPAFESHEDGSFVAADRRFRLVEMQYLVARIGRPWEEALGDISTALHSTGMNFLGAKRVWISPEIIAPPYLDTFLPTPAHYGGAGVIFAHELAHGLPGPLRVLPAGSTTTADAYQCLQRHFDQIATTSRVPLDVGRVAEEYTADLTGVRIALAAMVAAESADDSAKANHLREFFVAFAQGRCAVEGDYRSVVESASDTHPSAVVRINGVVSQIDEFARAFSCAPGTPMAPQTRCIAPWP